MDYKEKLRLAKEALESGSYDRETIEYIFPELKESEDEKVRKELLLDIPKVFPYDKAFRYIAYLEKQGKQKPAEWSEEDERIKNNLLSELTNLSVRKLIEKETEKKYASWLKSLRPQSTWKPSEEEMGALDSICASNYLTTTNTRVLQKLYDALKKLKE